MASYYDDLTSHYQYVEETLHSGAGVEAGFLRLVDYCKLNQPHSVWDRIRDISIQGDIYQLRSWLESVLLSEPPPKNIKAFYFGIFNPVLDYGQVSCDMCFSGSTRFDPNDEDWACWYPDSYNPNREYARSRVLHEIYSLVAKEASIAELGEFVLCLGYACLAVKEIFADSPLPVAVGFDSGDLILVKP